MKVKILSRIRYPDPNLNIPLFVAVPLASVKLKGLPDVSVFHRFVLGDVLLISTKTLVCH